jgi:hypothetical protein
MPGKENDTMNDDISISAKSAGLNEQSYISELRDAYENSVRAITSTEIWFSLIYSNSYCDADICGLLKERDSLRAQLAEKDKELFAARELIDVAKTTIRKKNAEIMRLKSLKTP